KLAAEHPRSPDHQSNLGSTYHNLAQLLLDRGNLEEARQLLAKAVRCQQAARQVRAGGDPLFREFLGDHYASLGDVQIKSGKYAEAATYHRKALDLRVQLAKEFPQTLRHRSRLAWSQAGLGRALMELGQGKEAETACRRAVALSDKLVT